MEIKPLTGEPCNPIETSGTFRVQDCSILLRRPYEGRAVIVPGRLLYRETGVYCRPRRTREKQATPKGLSLCFRSLYYDDSCTIKLQNECITSQFLGTVAFSASSGSAPAGSASVTSENPVMESLNSGIDRRP
ncbi:hypothetical protein JZ751_003078 [Albula glossodonta]|uniref:Uncharacterized protein n=1 Tax=Albula glossodonta TaxID=121402 RepID=A0A8T2NBM4_9TELE|nr:hypothetical protein JZ751_003078 [Albula glossodonta]